MSTTLLGEQVDVGNGAAGCGEKAFAKAVAAFEKASERDSLCGCLTEPVMSGTSGGWCKSSCVLATYMHAHSRSCGPEYSLPCLIFSC